MWILSHYAFSLSVRICRYRVPSARNRLLFLYYSCTAYTNKKSKYIAQTRWKVVSFVWLNYWNLLLLPHTHTQPPIILGFTKLWIAEAIAVWWTHTTTTPHIPSRYIILQRWDYIRVNRNVCCGGNFTKHADYANHSKIISQSTHRFICI